MLFTVKDVARLAGASKITVSHVMNNNYKVKSETKTRVLQAVKELGYSPNSIARVLRMKKSDEVGVIIPRGVEPLNSNEVGLSTKELKIRPQGGEEVGRPLAGLRESFLR